MRLVECFRCEKKFEPRDLLHTGGCSLCKDCFDYIEREWPKEMEKEYNHQQEKCKGCEG